MGYSSSDDSSSEGDSFYPEESAPIVPPVKNWDKFREIPPQSDTGSAAESPLLKNAEKILLLVAYTLTFLIVLGAGVTSRGTTFFMISQISMEAKNNLPFCNGDSDSGYFIFDAQEQQLEVDFQCTTEAGNGTSGTDLCDYNIGVERSAWLWCIFFAFSASNVGALLRSMRIWLFKFQNFPRMKTFIFVLIMEMCSVTGMALLVFLVLPEMDTLRGMGLTAGLVLVPSILLPFTRIERRAGNVKFNWKYMILDIPAVLVQVSAVLTWPVLQYTTDNPDIEHPYAWAIPVSCVLVSCSYWETYVGENFGFYWMWEMKTELIEKSRYFTYLFIAPLKIAVFFGSMVLITFLRGTVTNQNESLDYFDIMFDGFLTSFGNHNYTVRQIDEESISDDGFKVGLSQKMFYEVGISDSMTPVYVLIIQILCSYFAYVFAKFASKVQIQTFSFAIPIVMVMPVCILLLILGCGARANDSCVFIDFLPNNLFFECPKLGDFFTYTWESYLWLYLIWFASFLWVTYHIWFPRSTRLASTEQIFGTPWYEGLFIDHSIILNRRKDGEVELKTEELLEFELGEEEEIKEMYEIFPESGSDSKHSNVKNTDKMTKIYACATMWHENEEEMLEMLKSLFRIDYDYSARRLSQKYLGVVDQDYYEWETHILFDDAFEVGDNPEEAQVINPFVRLLVETMNKAGSHFYKEKIKIKPCKKYPTPYGGRLVWTLPGKTRIVCHLKDKEKIRHKKRWSQCMYMYYLLGHKLMELHISDDRKEAMAENTYLLALDGDIDFQPQSIVRLVDLMKKNRNVGAACGRIHPTGSGYIPWYQKFEYAIGHWLQKATEHILGCVLCSPGCFSLFRGKALMDDNVMRKYTTVSTQPRHYVQFDQGEDRWLCTLLLQKGWRVEYSAASDAFTACPTTFDEFYNQRRRWMPSTIMNILDLLADYKSVINANQDISIFYILYQGFMMFSTFIGPGAIFLILAGALNTVFKVDIWSSILYLAIPVVLFCIVCYGFDSKIQLAFAKLLTIAFILLMLAVLIGIFIQIAEDNSWLSPTAISFLSVFLSFLIAGILHPYEIGCLPYLVIYYITIPSMYLLLTIYSLFNLWNVSWGTREVAQKKTKAEMEAEKASVAEVQKKVKNEGMLNNLLQQFNLQGGGGESGGMEFSLANLFKCMCFTHDDPLDPKKQMVEIAASLDKVNHRLSNIEHAHEISGMPRRSSFSRRRMTAVQEILEEDTNDIQDYQSQATEDSMSLQVPEERKVERDDLKNPYWLEDFYPDNPELGGGTVDYLPGAEIVFWNEMIKKYLTPLVMDKKQKADQLTALKEYRDGLIFTFIMANLLWVLGITLMQQSKDIMSINWFLDIKYNVTYEMEAEQGPEITIFSENLELEPIGLFFLISFLLVMFFQILGMIIHRWTNLCHTLATTKLDWCERKDTDVTEDGDLDKQALDIVRDLQTAPKQPKKQEEIQNVGRRNTIHQLSAYHTKVQGDGEEINLEKQFRKRLNSNAELDMLSKRLSIRRETVAALNKRRDSFMTMERRRSTVHFAKKSFSSQGRTNSGFDSDLGDEMTDISGASTYKASELGRNSLQFDTYVTSSNM